MTVERLKLANLTRHHLLQLQEQFAGKDAEVEISVPSESNTSSSPGEMNEDKFWESMELLDWTKAGNDDAVIEPVVQFLSKLPESAILTFYDLLSEKLYLLDSREFAVHSSEEGNGISSDLFLYARCCVVANGRRFYENVLKNPASFPKDIFFEAILKIPERAWFRKTGKSLEYSPKYIYETGFNPSGWGADTITL